MNGSLVERQNLTPGMQRQMYELLCRHFRGVSTHQFDRDLQEKNWVVLLHDDEDQLVGFSTFDYYTITFEDRLLYVVFSGDTIMDRSAWHSPVLPRTWIESVLLVHEPNADVPLYWLLITSGYRTYRFLPVFWRDFYPCHHSATPSFEHRLINHLATHRFGSQYDHQTGIVRFTQPQTLCPGLQLIPEGKHSDPHIAFFQQANPHWQAGDELVCLTRIEKGNLTRAGLRMVFGGWKAGVL